MQTPRLITYLARIIIICIQHLRPILGAQGVCPFTIGCTEYAMMQFQEQPFWTACYNTIKRLLACNPITNWCKQKL